MSNAHELSAPPPSFVLKDLSGFAPKDRSVIASKIAKIERKVFPAIEHFNYDVELKKHNTGVILAFRENNTDTPVAYLVYQRMKKLAWLHKLCVLEQEREKGLGKALIHSLRRHMEKGGCHTIVLWVDENRQPARALYKSCGFQQTECRPDYYECKVFPTPTRRRVTSAIVDFWIPKKDGCGAMANLLAYMTFLPLLVAALPQVNYPLNVQYPPVARVGRPFSFQFAPTTFLSSSGYLQYSLIGNPSWLSLDDNRTLSGTPHSSDLGTVSFTIVAAEAAGAVANMDSQLLVSGEAGPTSKPFSISFPSDTFDASEMTLSYSALLSDRTPLPAWISFDSSSIRFAGTTPPTDYSQSIRIVLIAREEPGFAASSISFTMVISDHTLLFKSFSQTVNVATGTAIRIAKLKDKLYLDGSQVGDDDLQSVTADLPSWLSFDKSTFEITETAPSGLQSQDLIVTAKAHSGNIAQYTIHLLVQSVLFADEIDALKLMLGQQFEYQIPRTVLTEENESVTVDLAALGNYLRFDSRSLTISGTVPVDFPIQDVQCSLTAISDDGVGKESQTFQIKVLEAAGDGPNQAFDDGIQAEQGSDGRKTAIIAGAVIGSICGAFLLVALAICLRRRRKLAKSYISPKLPRSPKKSEISRPMFVPYGSPELGETAEQDEEKGKDTQDPFVAHTSEDPPKLDLNRDSGMWSLDTFNESSFGIYNDTAPSQHPPDSMKIPTELAKRASQNSNTFRKHRRRTTNVYHDQIHRSTGLPVNRRITGAGHGRHTYSPSRTNTNFSSIRRPMSTGSYATTRCTSTFSTTPSAFPQSPSARKHTTLVTPTEVRRSIRVVPASRRSSLAYRRTVDEKRNSYIRKRASTQSPFFSADTRASSSSYRSPPAFIAEALSSPCRVALSPTTRNTIVRPDDDVVAGKEKEIPVTLRIVRPSGDHLATPTREFPGSLRKNRANRPLTAISPPCDRIEKSYARPGTAILSGEGSFGRRASTRHSLRAHDLKASLNDLTGSKVFEDAEMSDSVYSDEERDIEEAEKRSTVKPGQYTLLPLNLDRVDTARNGKRGSKTTKEKSKRDNKRELKRTSEREPTPYYPRSEHEQGGKENASSTYTLGQRSSPSRVVDIKGKARALSSPERPKLRQSTISATKETRKSHRASANRTSKAPSHQEATIERHSRKSIHSRAQPRQSSSVVTQKPRDRSRTQSSAYSFFDATIFEATDGASITLPAEKTKSSHLTRDLSGNLTFHGGDGYSDDEEEPTIEELGSRSIGFRTSNGRVNPVARESRLASLHLASSPSSSPPAPPPKSQERQTVLPVTSSPAPIPASVSTPSLGLFPRESMGDGKRERTRLSTVQARNGATPEPEARKTWGNLSLKSIVGRGSRWVSGGGGYWDKQRREDKVFI
ncbi:hypothetical protein BDW02DRAFT_644053 [Decorospora gaudefroyi]|uniref:N-acetyltransferase domain-containing protein n=1 Tax=Decorospora gaudefroyi TaxID=184978 RepID=A0A6A5KLC4_9PLEO|nr:hypothetical protein BDW02DRAFT_644053 [Decorospora gaudefroyi]